ncbi:MAG: tRNA uridine-5-carboxymethylaminomethyl(34) synthesis GTPase MnmE, partial [Candidatus Marinimicrobia bacterium]|nr:tRNA uridine-5-carboxymethylaminomethyl(34) synthesis GTPase MnmE [Candidatus Neomarinimicrobiota bacterium]
MTTGDTIVAPATPFGYSGIAVIRISGPNSFNYLSALSGKKQLNDREATLSSLKDGSGSQIDRCLFTAFFGPKSYTGEDLVEISTHGNPAVVEDVVNAFCSLGARPANAGEFTKRAFLNGKM